MTNLRKTFTYLFHYNRGRRFITLFLLFLIPSAIFALFFPLGGTIDFFKLYHTANYQTWGALYWDILGTNAYSYIGLAAGAIILIPLLSYAATLITRNIRVGDFTLPKFGRSVNENFFSALAVAVYVGVISAAAHLLFSLFAYSFLNIADRSFGLALTCVAFILLFLAIAILMAPASLWMPIMSFTGSYALKGLSAAFYKFRSCRGQTLLSMLVICGVTFGLSMAAQLVGLWYITFVLNTIIYTFSITVHVTFSMISYCEAESVKREDAVRRYFGR